MMHRNAIWKPGIAEIAKASGALPLDRTRKAYPEIPTARAYDHRTQSFMKNGGQQKCLDKALSLKKAYLEINERGAIEFF